MAAVIKEMESQGQCDRPGSSGERGCWQWLQTTWNHWSRIVFNEARAMTYDNEEEVALYKIQHHLNQGHTPDEVALIWNQGNDGPCSSGYNKQGVWYDSCAYHAKFIELWSTKNPE